MNNVMVCLLNVCVNLYLNYCCFVCVFFELISHAETHLVNVRQCIGRHLKWLTCSREQQIGGVCNRRL
jgi:hypothetical protein